MESDSELTSSGQIRWCRWFQVGSSEEVRIASSWGSGCCKGGRAPDCFWLGSSVLQEFLRETVTVHGLPAERTARLDLLKCLLGRGCRQNSGGCSRSQWRGMSGVRQGVGRTCKKFEIGDRVTLSIFGHLLWLCFWQLLMFRMLERTLTM